MLTLDTNPGPITNTYDNAKFVAAAQAYFNYVYETRYISPAKSKLNAHLKKGLSPDIYVVSPVSGQLLSLLACSIEMDNIFILRFLLQHGASPLKPISPSEICTPLHLICEKIKRDFYLTYRNNRFSREMYHLIFAAVRDSHPKFCQGLEKDLRSAFIILYHRILKEWHAAKKQGKRLLIMMGEKHTSTLEVILNAMLIEIGIRLEVSNLMIEQSEKYLTHLEDVCQAQQIIDNPYLIDQVWCPAIGNHIYGYRRGMKVIPIDLKRDGTDTSWNISSEGLVKRESAMVEQILNHDNEDGFCTVGLAHMERLIHDPKIETIFHVFPINATFTANTEEVFAFAYSSEVFQISDLFSLDFIEKADSMLAPIDGLNIITDIAQNLVLEENPELSASEGDDEDESHHSRQGKHTKKKCIIC